MSYFVATMRVLSCVAVPLALVGASPPGGVLRVEVRNVRAVTGHVHVEVCPEALFLKDCTKWVDAPARVGTTIVTVRDLPPGRYSVQAFYDQNGNNKVDHALFGIPKEGVGFSNDAKIRFGPPKWADAMFDYDGQPQTIRLRLRYFSGPDAPATQ